MENDGSNKKTSKYRFIKKLSETAYLCEDFNDVSKLFVVKHMLIDIANSNNLLREASITKLINDIQEKKDTNCDNNIIHEDTPLIQSNNKCADFFGSIYYYVKYCYCLLFCIKTEKSSLSIKSESDFVEKNIICCKFVSLDISPTKYYLITEWAGMDLFEYISSNDNLNIQTVKNIFRQIVEGINYLHLNGISHADLSMENICVKINNTGKINVHLIDFGLSIIHPLSTFDHKIYCFNNNSDILKPSEIEFSNVTDKSTLSVTIKNKDYIFGKIQYISPERYNANLNESLNYCAYLDDIYSLGVILFCMTTKKMPYHEPIEIDERFNEIICGKWKQDEKYKIYGFSDESQQIVDLIDGIIKYQNNRISIKNILEHCFLSKIED